jgi:monofunctional biosynthetic peptidoglycan transglycosylase
VARAPGPESNRALEDQPAPSAKPTDAAADIAEELLLAQPSPTPVDVPTPGPAPWLTVRSGQPVAAEPPPWPELDPEPRVPAEPPPASAHENAEVPPSGVAEVPPRPASREETDSLPSTIAEPPRHQAAAADGGLAFVRAETAAPVFPTAIAASTPAVALPSASDGFDRAWPYLRLALKAAAVAVVGLTTLVLLLVVLYRWVNPPTSTLLLSQRLAGVEIEQRWAPLRRISPNLVRAVVLSEDGGFCRHRGVDWRALEAAVETGRGGSTITMQVVKNLFLWLSRSYVRKAIEIALAYPRGCVLAEGAHSEVYLNIAEWGDGVFGAEAAAGTISARARSAYRAAGSAAGGVAAEPDRAGSRSAGAPGAAVCGEPAGPHARAERNRLRPDAQHPLQPG